MLGLTAASQKLRDLDCNLLNRMGCRAACNFVSKGRAEVDNLLFGDVVPDGQEQLLTGHGASDDSVKLVVCPSLSDERR